VRHDGSSLLLKKISATNRYLFPPISKTMYGATKPAVLNVRITSGKLTQVARLATQCLTTFIRPALWSHYGTIDVNGMGSRIAYPIQGAMRLIFSFRLANGEHAA
jgi:hypothetical protein